MRLLRLDLLAFGPFTDQSLEFGDGGLHIVHGRNEAGKSSSLRALRNLLYGIPARSTDDFVHSYQNLRVGGLFEAADGTRLEFLRRKGNTKTLLGPDGITVLEDALLHRLLGGVDETTFQQRFGIDYDELRRGGQAVVDGGGDLKEILFAAGAGVADLRTIQQQLDEEGSELFKPQGSRQSITEKLKELKAAREEIKEKRLPTSHWVEHDKALQQARNQLQEFDTELKFQRTERSRLKRVRDSLPLIGGLKPLRQRLVELAQAPLLPDTFSADRAQAESKLEDSRHDAQQAEREIQRLEEQLGGINVPTDLLEHRTAIAQLHTQLGSHQKAASDRPGLFARCEAARQSAQQMLEQLGGATTLDEADALRLPKVQRKRIQALAVECKVLIDRQQSSETALRKTDAGLQNILQSLQGLPSNRDTSDLQRTIRRVQKYGDLDEQLRSQRGELERLQEEARIDLAKLPLFSGTLDELETLKIPREDTIERFENTMADAEDRLRRCRESIDSLRSAARQCQTRLDALRLEGEVPTEADLNEARSRRDAGWELVRQAWHEGSDADTTAGAFIDEFAAGGDLAGAFLASIDRADRLADRLRREATRVAEKAGLTAELQRTEADLVQAQQQLATADQQHQHLLREWQAQWAAAGIAPLPPREMRAWGPRHLRLAQTAADLRQRHSQLQQHVERVGALRDELSDALQALDCPRQPHDLSLSATLEFCLHVAEQLGEAQQQRQQLEADQQRLVSERPEIAEQARQTGQQLADWRSQWAEAVAALGLKSDARPDETNAVIETVDDMHKQLDESRTLQERISGIDLDAGTFEQSVRQLIEQIAPDLLEQLDVSAQQAVADLVDRLSRAGKDQTKLDGWHEQLRTQQTRLAAARAQTTRWQQAFDGLCEQAGCTDPEQLPNAEQQSRDRKQVESAVQSLQQQLCQLAAGAELDDWMATVETFELDQVQADLARLEESIASLEQQQQQVSVEIGRNDAELRRMDGSGRAAEAQLQAEHLLAGIRNDAEEYIRLRLASAVLSRAMERFRQASQGPVLERAAELFQTLTLGSFESLRQDCDDGGRDVLVGVRPGRQIVHTSGMSAGTCDQLYLALRVALLESSLQGREPLPLVVDDILIMFDDARATAALNVLSQLAEKTQVIFFTHHAHLVDIARDVLKSAAHFHELQRTLTLVPA